uniref:Vitellogenin n=1 Tax=Polyrhachis vicina TaxID=455035 RepID=A0A2H5BER7_9HYME|nr:vitellogenin [Polyrhachis vicina]
MWSHHSLFLIVAVGVAVSYCDQHENHEYAWSGNQEYKYLVQSTTVTSVDDPHYKATGITLKGVLVVQTETPYMMYGTLRNFKYAHTKTPYENSQELDEQYYDVPLSGKSFQFTVKDGVIRDLTVHREIPVWEVNIMKSVLSQLQVDTGGKRIIPSRYNQVSEDYYQPYAAYKVMEDSIGGNCEVFYDIAPLSGDIIKNSPELVPMPRLDDGNFIEIRKTKDFTNCNEQHNYYHNQTNSRSNWPYLTRDRKSVSQLSTTYMVISGNLKSFTTQSSVTKSNIFIKSTDKKDSVIGNVFSLVNLTLVEKTSVAKPLEGKLDVTIPIGSLVYAYKNPFSEYSKVGPHLIRPDFHEDRSSSESSSEETVKPGETMFRKNQRDFFDGSSSSSSSSEETTGFDHSSLGLREIIYNPYCPFFIGISGRNKSRDLGVEESAANLIIQIAKGLQNPSVQEPDETIEIFTIVQNLLHTMTTDQLTLVEQYALKLASDSAQRSLLTDTVKSVIYQTITQIGTGPALVKFTEWVKNRAISNVEASNLVARIPKIVCTPSTEYFKQFYEMISTPELLDIDIFNVSAPIAFAKLIRNVQLDKRNYPVKYRLPNDDFAKYISYLAKQLKEAVYKEDNTKIRTYIAAVATTSHPQILSVFEPYLEGKQNITKLQQTHMIDGLFYLFRTYPALTRAILSKIYSNVRRDDETRIAAFYALIKTNPPLLTFLRLAQFTNYDTSTKVNSAVVSTIHSLTKLKRVPNVAFKARLARKLLKKNIFGSPTSFGYFVDSDKENAFLQNLYLETIKSGEYEHVQAGLYAVNDYLKLSHFRFGYAVSNIKEMRDFFISYYNLLVPNKQRMPKRTIAEEIASALDIKSYPHVPLEGYAFLDSKYDLLIYSFDEDSIKRDVKKFIDTGKTERFTWDTIYNHDEVLGFPTESGLPFIHTVQTPIIQKFIPKDLELAFNNFEIKCSADLLFASKVQNRWGFTVPFELQQYHAGVDRDFHVHLPVTFKIKQQSDGINLQMKMNPTLSQMDQRAYKLLHFSTVPFVVRQDVLNFEPLSRNKKIMEEVTMHNNFRMGVFNTMIETSKDIMRTPNLRNILNFFMSSNQGDNDFKKIDIYLDSDAAKEGINLNVTHVQSNTENPAGEQDVQTFTVTDGRPNSEARRKQFLTEVSKGLQYSHNHVLDIDLEYPTSQGPERQVITFGVGHSNAEEKYRTLFYGNTQPAKSERIDHEVFSTGIAGMSQRTPLDFQRMVDQKQQSNFEFILQYGKSYVNGEKLYIKGNLTQSSDLKNTIRNNPVIKECLRNMQESPACQKAMQFVQRKDRINFLIKNTKTTTQTIEIESVVSMIFDLINSIFDKVGKEVTPKWDKNMLEVEFKMLEDYDEAGVFVPSFDRDISSLLYGYLDRQSQTTWEWGLQFLLDILKKLDLELSSQLPESYHMPATITSMESPEYMKPHMESLMKFLSIKKQISFLLNSPPLSPSCNVGKDRVITFDGKAYPVQAGENWQVFLISNMDLPSDTTVLPRTTTVLSKDLAILVKIKDGSKQVLCFLGTKNVQLQKTNDDIEVLIDGTRVKQYKQDKQDIDKTSYQYVKDNEIYLEIYELPDKSVVMKSCKYGVNVVYNGETIEIQVAKDYRDNIRGLCGNYDSQPENDFITPRNCIAQRFEDFCAMYTLSGNTQEGFTAINKDKQYPCVQQLHYQGDVISDIDAGRPPTNWNLYSNKALQKEGESKNPFIYRTKIEERDSEICFSTRPIPACEYNTPTKTKFKTYEFFCKPRSQAEQLKRRVEQGANPDFSQKPVSHKKTYEVPLSCLTL